MVRHISALMAARAARVVSIAVALICAAVVVCSGSAKIAWADTAYVRLVTFTGDTSQGSVGFSEDDMGAYREAWLEPGSEHVFYAKPADG